MKTKGQMEAEISNAMTKFEMEYMGRGPKETKAYACKKVEALTEFKGFDIEKYHFEFQGLKGRGVLQRLPPCLV